MGEGCDDCRHGHGEQAYSTPGITNTRAYARTRAPTPANGARRVSVAERRRLSREGEATKAAPQPPRYVGQWVGDTETGLGRMTLTDGETYEGEWLERMRLFCLSRAAAGLLVWPGKDSCGETSKAWPSLGRCSL